MSNNLEPDRPDILLGLICDQTVCKGYQQTTKVANSVEKVKKNNNKQLRLKKRERENPKLTPVNDLVYMCITFRETLFA